MQDIKCLKIFQDSLKEEKLDNNIIKINPDFQGTKNETSLQLQNKEDEKAAERTQKT